MVKNYSTEPMDNGPATIIAPEHNQVLLISKFKHDFSSDIMGGWPVIY
jgi:hypothetical protein